MNSSELDYTDRKSFVPLHNLHTEKVHTIVSNLLQL